MNELEIVSGKKRIKKKTASCWDELSSEQFIAVVRTLPQVAVELFPDDLLRLLLSIDKKLFDKIPPIQKYHLCCLFSFLEEKPELSELLVESFRVDGIEYVGYMSDFSNTTWEEFLFADQYFMDNQYLEAIAVLYRERKKKRKYDGQSDIRIPFSIYGTEKRLQAIQGLDSAVVTAIALNYQALRQRYLAERYTQVFSGSSGKDSKDNSFSWWQVHRNFLGEVFFEEAKILQSNVHTVFHRMNSLIKENKKKK